MVQNRNRGVHGHVGKGGNSIPHRHGPANRSKSSFGKGSHHSAPKGNSHGHKGWHVRKESLKHDHRSAGSHSSKGKGGSAHGHVGKEGNSSPQRHGQANSGKCNFGKGSHHSVSKGKSHGHKGWHIHKESSKHDHQSAGSHSSKGKGGSAHERHIQHVRYDSQRLNHDRHGGYGTHHSSGSHHDNKEFKRNKTNHTRKEAKGPNRFRRITKSKMDSLSCSIHGVTKQKYAYKRHSIVRHSMAGRPLHVRKTFEKSSSIHQVKQEKQTALTGKPQRALAVTSGARSQFKLVLSPRRHRRRKNIENEQPKPSRGGFAASVAERLKLKKRSGRHGLITSNAKRAVTQGQCLVKPSQVRFSQHSISDTFRDGNSLKDTQRAIASGTMLKRSIPPIRVFRTRKGNLVSHDNRRLAMYQKLEMNNQVGKIKVELTKERVPKWKLSTLNRGLAVRLRRKRQGVSVAGSSSNASASTNLPNTMVMFHGTSPESAAMITKEGFRPSSDGMLGPGVYLSRDVAKAKRYGNAVLEVSADLGRVKRIDRQGHELQKTWSLHGYDSAWCPPKCGMVPSGLEEDCIRDPSRVKVRRLL